MPFPLPEAPVDTVISQYGQFSDAELATVVRSSGDVLAHDDPVRHLLNLREQPYLRLFEGEADAAVGSVVAYRSAVCLGATMLRRYARHRQIDLAELHVNPERKYLLFPDLPLPEAYRRFGAWPIVTEDFADPQYYRQFFQHEASAARVRSLRDELAANHVAFMDSESERSHNFGFFCRGLLDTFELYAQLRRERKLGAPDQVFDAERHRLLNAPAPWATMPNAVSTEDAARRWRVGGLTSAHVTDNSMWLGEQIGDTTAPAKTAVLGVSRAIGSFARQSALPDSGLVPVTFTQTEEQFALNPRDTLIVRSSRDQSGIFSSVGYPFVIQHDPLYPSAEVVALCREGQVRFLYDPAINPELEDATLADAIHFAMARV